MVDMDLISKPETKELMVCFADLTLFAKVSRSMSSVEVFGMLDRLFITMEEHVKLAGGYIIKYEGDSALIVFDKENMDNGIKALIDSKNEIDNRFIKAGKPNRLAVNCHFGEVTVGRFQAKNSSWVDIIGDTVQYASILGRYKNYGLNNDFIISKDVFDRLGKDAKSLFHRFTPPLIYRADY
jgi:class 3 adenylate cyclase